MSAKDPNFTDGRFASATRVALAADNTSITDHALADKFILACQLDEQAGPWTAVYKVQWRRVLGTFADLGSSTEMAYTTDTDLVNGDAVVIGEKIVTETPSATWVDGEEVEGTGTADSITLIDERYTEIQFAIDPANALNDQAYEFQVYDVTNGASIGVFVGTLTTETAITPVTINCAVGTLTLTGNSAIVSTIADITIPCTIGTLTLTGNSAIVSTIEDIIVPCTIGVLTLTPNTAQISSELGVIVDIDHEDGTSDEWDTLVNTPTVNSGSALMGPYGLDIDAINGTPEYCTYDFTISSNQIRIRYYFDPNSLTMADADEFTIGDIALDGTYAGRTWLHIMAFRYASGSYQVLNMAADDDGGNTGLSADIITDAPHYIEILISRESYDGAADGYYTKWIDGVFKSTASNIENYNIFRTIDTIRMGAMSGVDVGTSGNFYLDNLIINDTGDEIGEASYSYGILVDINHEDGTTDEWTTLVNTPTVNNGAALVGSYGLDIDAINGTLENAEYEFTISTDQIRIRFYLDPNTLSMADNNAFDIIAIMCDSTHEGRGLQGVITLKYTIAGGYVLDVNFRDDPFDSNTLLNSQLTDGPQYVELLLVRESYDGGVDGYFSLWIDGALQGTQPDIDNYNLFRTIRAIRTGTLLGGVQAGTSGNFYLDDFIINDTGVLIGPADVNPTVSCNLGVLTLTGNTVTIIPGAIVVPCQVGVLTLTGNTAAVSSPPPSTTVNCSIGVLTLTGNNASLIPGAITVLANVGTVTLSGNNTSILKGAISVSCQVGVLTFTGNSATILKGSVTVSCQVGILNLTGNSATILKGPITISCQVGVLDLTGNNVTISSLPPARIINCSLGVVTLSGQTASLIPGAATVQSNVGTVTLSGNQATILKGAISVSCQVGVLTLTGNTASISSPPPAQTIDCSLGVVTLSGQTADVVTGPVTVACQIGVLNLTGNSANVILAGAPQTVSCSVGVLNLTGNNASVVAGPVTISCSIGVVTLTGNQASITSFEGQVVSCSAGSLSITGNQASVLPGAVSIACSITPLELQGQSASILAGAITVPCQIGTVSLSGNSASISAPPPSITVSCSVGIIQLSGQGATILAGGVLIGCQVGEITLSGNQASVVPGPVTVSCGIGTITLVGLQVIPQIGIPNVKGTVIVGNELVHTIEVGNFQLYEITVDNMKMGSVEVTND